KDNVGVVDAAQRTEGEQALVFQTNGSGRGSRRTFVGRAARLEFVDVFAADRAGGAAFAGADVRLVDRLGSEPLGAGELAGLKVARRQRAESVEREQVGDRAQLAVLGGRGAERLLRQIAAVSDE